MGKQPPKYRDIELYHMVIATDRNSYLIQANMRDRDGLIIGKTFEIGDGMAKWHGAPKYVIYEVLAQLYRMNKSGKLKFRDIKPTPLIAGMKPPNVAVWQRWIETGQVFAGEWHG